MSRIATRTRLPLPLLTGMFGVLLLTYLVRRVGPAELLKNMATLGWGLALVIAWGGVSHLVKTWAWRLTLLDEKLQVSFARMLGLRLASEAVGQLGALGQLFGETLRVSLLGPTMPLASGITSVTLDRALFIISATVVSIVGLVAVLVVLPLPHTLSLYARVFVFILAAVILVAALAVRKRWPVFSGPARILARIRYLNGWMERKHSLIHSVENKLLDFYHHTPGAFWSSFALNMACHGAAVLEVYLILWLMGAKISLFAALAIEALTKLVSTVGTFNPGNIGTYEGGNMLIVKMFGLSGAAGLMLAFIRRLRATFWAAVGGLCLVILSKSRKHRISNDSTHDRIPVTTNLTLPAKTPNKSEFPVRSHVAVILANNADGESSFGAPLPQVGALPVLLRAILGAQKAGAGRIVVVVDPVTGPCVKHDLLNTDRLPGFVEWVTLGGEGTSLPSLLGQLVGELGEQLVLIAGDRTYHPSLHRRAGNWDGKADALALTTGNQLVGIYALSQEAAINLAKHCRSKTGTLEKLHSWLTRTQSVQCDPVPEDMWQPVLTPQQCLLAEQKLNRWLVKHTDGIYARMNRRISIPISRQIIRFPITPNMVSLFTLGVSFAGGVLYAFGGYLNMLTGAFLGLFASILDGCDGEVARLKLQESDIGCWLETICDYLYYLFTFAGMAIGLFRSSGQRSYLVWGGLLFFGAVASFITTGLQRHQLASGRPAQYLGIWQAQAASRRSNPLLYLGRNSEFIIRRCFFPYFLLFFALFNITNIAFILSAVGSNVVWPIALYSYLTFGAVKGSTAASPAASAWERVDLIRQSHLG
jgi:phosphatidylglycerophosphate synthase